MYVYKPVVDYIVTKYPVSGQYAEVMFFFWGAIAGIFLLASGIRLLMQMQRKTGY